MYKTFEDFVATRVTEQTPETTPDLSEGLNSFDQKRYSELLRGYQKYASYIKEWAKFSEDDPDNADGPYGQISMVNYAGFGVVIRSQEFIEFIEKNLPKQGSDVFYEIKPGDKLVNEILPWSALVYAGTRKRWFVAPGGFFITTTEDKKTGEYGVSFDALTLVHK